MERPAVRPRRHRRARGRPGRPDRGAASRSRPASRSREADVIVFVVDAITGLTPADHEAAELLRRPTAPVIVAVNKADNAQRELEAAEFYALGWEETYAISASHGRGTGDLLDAIVWALPPETDAELARKAREDEADEWADEVAAGRLEPFVVGADGSGRPDEDDEDERRSRRGGRATVEAPSWDAAIAAEADDAPAAIAFVGRPNVGKSSLLNALLGEERAIVSEVPGTTRDAIDTRLDWGRSEVVLIDTAGIRRRGKVASGPAAERYSTLRALKAIGRADVAVLVIDAVEGLTAQDAHVAGYVVEEGKGLVIAVNKWDLVEEKTDRTFDQYVEWIRNEVPFLDFAPIVSISAKTGQRVGKVLELAIDIWGERRKRVSTGELNRVLRAAAERQAPPVVKGRRPKLFYATQAAVAPPTFVFFANDAALGPLLLPALPREPAARGVRLRRHADPAGLPRPRRRSSCPQPRAPERRRERRSNGAGAPRRPAERRARRRSDEPSRAARRAAVAVVGAGAWGTTLALLLGPVEPVIARSRHRRGRRAERIDDRARERAPPARDRRCRPTSSSRPTRRRSRAPVGPRHLRRPVDAPARDGGAASPAPSTPTADVLSVVKGLERGHAPPDDRGHRRRRRRSTRAGSPPCPGPNLAARDRPRPARSARRRGRGAGARRPDRRAARPARVPALRRTATSSASSCAGRSRTSSRSPRAPPTGSASATTARPG